MTRDEAVALIAEDLGFRTGLDDRIVRRLQDAQRDLEAGKTLPHFLLVEDADLSLAQGARLVQLPERFIREKYDERIRYVSETSEIPTFLTRIYSYDDAVLANVTEENLPAAPLVYFLRSQHIDFITTADQAYELTWSYYQKAEELTSNLDDHAWLNNDAGNLWLRGEAGYRMAAALRDKDAVALFDIQRKQGRAACFGEEIAREESGGPMQLGANN